MSKRLLCSFSLALVCGLALTSVTSAADPSLVGWWKLDETSGTTAADSSGNGNTGTVNGPATWVAGQLGGGLQLSGTNNYVECGNGASLNMRAQVTLSAWIKPTTAGNGQHQHYVTKGDTCYALKHNTGNYMEFNVYDGAWYTASGPAVNAATFNNVWHHVAGTYDGTTLKIYVDGVLQPTTATHVGQIGASSTSVTLGRDNTNNGRYFTGIIDDARIYNRALSDVEILKVMAGGEDAALASKPNPADKATDVPRDAALSWVAGDFAKTHDVYFGTAYDEVNDATVATSAGQSATTFDPAGLLAFGQTYYWRVDEVNAPDKPATFKGKTWSFAAENFAYRVTPTKATASSMLAATMGPEKTIDGSGLDALDQHGTSASQMWLSKKNVSPIWIQYEFDKAYKLYEMWVWNSNQAVEQSVGFGAQDVTIETSLDGTTWTALANVPKFEQAPGDPNYTHNTTVTFGGVQAKFVKLTILTNWADGTKQAGLAEVRFFYVPVKAFGPNPANAGVDVALNGVLNWRAGREAVKHNVTVGNDANAVGNGTVAAKTVTDHTFSLSSLALEYGKTYYWKVDEVNDAADTKVWAGDVWSFTTIGYGVIDDFESYDDVCNRIFFAWADGLPFGASSDCGVAAYAGNGTGATVGNAAAPFAEQSVTHNGSRQSLPMWFDNTKSPFYSETQREWQTAQSWTGGGANTMTVWVRGDAAAFVETSPGNIIMNGTGTDIWNNGDEFRFVYKSLKGNGSITAKVNSVANTNAWAKAGVMIRESLDTASTFVDNVVSAASGLSLQHRDQTAGACTNTDSTGLAAPYWVKLTRNGSTFTAQQSVDGVKWVDVTPATAFTITMADTVFIGLAVTSHQTGSVCGASFSNVSTTGGVSGTWQTSDVGVSQVNGNTPEAFYVAIQDSAGKLKVVSNPDTSIIATGVWQQWNIPFSQFTSGGVNLAGVKKVYVGVGDRNAPKSGGSGKIYIDDIQVTRVAQ
jgi:hypothetical protein